MVMSFSVEPPELPVFQNSMEKPETSWSGVGGGRMMLGWGAGLGACPGGLTPAPSAVPE